VLVVVVVVVVDVLVVVLVVVVVDVLVDVVVVVYVVVVVVVVYVVVVVEVVVPLVVVGQGFTHLDQLSPSIIKLAGNAPSPFNLMAHQLKDSITAGFSLWPLLVHEEKVIPL